MLPLDDQQQAARDWFEALRDRICAAFEAIEREAGSDAAFAFTPWDRAETRPASRAAAACAGRWPARCSRRSGSTSRPSAGEFSPEFAKSIPGAEDDPQLLRHRHQPGRAHGQPARARGAHEHALPDHHASAGSAAAPTSTRRFPTTKTPRPSTPACAPPAPPTTRPSIRAFRNGPRNISGCPTAASPRGVGGIFYDHLEDHFDAHFAFTRDVGEAFLDIFPQIVRKRMDTPFDEADMERLLEFRGRYVEFNLLYDRGTLFGLKTGGNIDAILMSLPPLAKWK